MPDIARWVVVDPLAETTKQQYSYANNDPINYIDFMGLSPVDFDKGTDIYKENRDIIIPHNIGPPIIATNILDKRGNLIKHIDDGSNAVFQLTGSGVDLHYEFTGFDESQGGVNAVNLITAIQEAQILNISNPSLAPNSATYCNYGTQNIQKTISSAVFNSDDIYIPGVANSMYNAFSSSDMYQEISMNEALENAKNGGLSIYSYKNPKGHGHVGTFSVGTNIPKGQTANIGSNNGFLPLVGGVFKRIPISQVKFYKLNSVIPIMQFQFNYNSFFPTLPFPINK